MSRRIRLVSTACALVAVAVSALYVPLAGADPRPRAILEGLDYLHARQTETGGFGSMPNTSWAMLAIAACGERPESTTWKASGKSPFTFLDTRSHDTAATAYDVESAPVYYATTIMAYVAAQRTSRVYIAGKPTVDLLARLYSYQDTGEGDTQGSFSPSASNRDFQAVRTTSWAILALHALNEDAKERFNSAMVWLAAQQLADGGFASESTAGATSNSLDTALAVQALQLADAGVVDPGVVPAARLHLKSRQRSDGGFGVSASGSTDSRATSAAIQAILALGESPADAYWTVGSNTPVTALRGLQLRSGAFAKQQGSSDLPVLCTSWSLLALRGKPFTAYPRSVGSTVSAFAFRPRITYASPKDKAGFTQTRSVLIRVSYTDGSGGTGVNASACRLYVDGVNKTKPATVTRYGLRLQLASLTNGSHSFKVRVVDYAGNAKELQRTFAVSVPVTSTAKPTTTWPTYAPFSPTLPKPVTPSTPRPVTTLTPLPTATATSSPPAIWPSPSADGSPIAGVGVTSPSPSVSPAAGGGNGGNSAGYVAGTLVALLPIGATAAYLLHHRRIAALDAARQGATLPSQGTSWHRIAGTFGGTNRTGGAA